MDGKAVLAAIKDQDEAGALSILEAWAAEQIAAAQGSAGAPAAEGTPPPGAPPVDGGATDMRGAPMPPKPGAKPGDEPPDSEESEARKAARKARQATMKNEEEAIRARLANAATEAEKSTAILRTTTIRARIAEARTVDKATINAEAEKLILASPSIEEAEIRLTLARGSAATTTQRARAVDPKTGAPLEVQTVEVEGANTEGLTPMDLQTIDALGGPRSSAGKQYAAEAQKVRARLAQGAAS